MAFLKETPRSLALFFVIAGLIGTIANVAEAAQLSRISQQSGGLSTLGMVYGILLSVCIFISVSLLLGGILFRKIATRVPRLIPGVLCAAILLKVLIAALVPATLVTGAISIAIIAYLLVQYIRISKELSTS